MERTKPAEGAAADSEHSSPDSEASRARTKMASGGSELRDHDFPVTKEQAARSPGAVAIDTGAPPPEAERSGGRDGTVDGDRQRVGTVGVIMNQDGSDPDSIADR